MDTVDVWQQFPEIETTRLFLRKISSEDENELFGFFSDPVVMKFYNIEPLKTVGEASALIERFSESFSKQTAIRWGIAQKYDNAIIGTCGFHNWVKSSFRAEIGYELSKSFWGQGIMSEALHAIITFGFKKLELNRIEAVVQPENLSSRGILRKLGFKEEGTLRQYGFFRGHFVDLIMYSLLKTD